MIQMTFLRPSFLKSLFQSEAKVAFVLTWDQGLFFLLLCFSGSRARASSRERHKGIIGRGHDLRLRSFGNSGFRFWNPDFGLFNRTRIPFSGWISIEKSKSKFLPLIMHARARPLFSRTVFQILFRTVKWKCKNGYVSVEIRFRISRSIANPKSLF